MIPNNATTSPLPLTKRNDIIELARSGQAERAEQCGVTTVIITAPDELSAVLSVAKPSTHRVLTFAEKYDISYDISKEELDRESDEILYYKALLNEKNV